jgi:hypothetical protein
VLPLIIWTVLPTLSSTFKHQKQEFEETRKQHNNFIFKNTKFPPKWR